MALKIHPMHLKLFAPSLRWPRLLNILTSNRGLWLSLGLLICLSIYGQLNVRETRTWVNRSFEVLDRLHQLESNLIEADAHLQSLTIAPASNPYPAYQAAIAAAQTQLTALRSLTADNPLQQQHLEQVEHLFENHLRQQQTLLQRISPNSRRAKPAARPGLYRDGIKAELMLIKQQEESLLEQRRGQVDRQGLFTSSLLMGGTLVVALMAASLQRARQCQRQLESELNQRLELIGVEQEQLHQRGQTIAWEQELSSQLLTCRSLSEVHEILQSLLSHLLPSCSGGLYEINRSRGQIQQTVRFGQFPSSAACSPRECWALRHGEIQSSHQATAPISCQLCRFFYGGDIPAAMMCLPLQAQQQTIGMLHLAAVPAPQQTIMITLARQISLPLAVLQLQSELKYLSSHDAHTGLYNRRFLDEMLARAIATAKRQNCQLSDRMRPCSVGVIFMEVDHFKRFNREHGYDMGDKALSLLSDFLIEMIRPRKDAPCRYGEEEFVVVMPGVSEAATLAKAEQIREGIKRRLALTGATISLSLGVAVYPEHGATAEEVLKAANQALLQAKTQGRDQVLLALKQAVPCADAAVEQPEPSA